MLVTVVSLHNEQMKTMSPILKGEMAQRLRRIATSSPTYTIDYCFDIIREHTCQLDETFTVLC